MNYPEICYLNLFDTYELYRKLPFFSWLFRTKLERQTRIMLYFDIRAASQAIQHSSKDSPHEAMRLTHLLRVVEIYAKCWAKE